MHPALDFLLAVGAVGDSIDSLAVAFGDGADIVGAAAAPLDFEHSDTGLEDFIKEPNGAEVFGRHDVLVVNFQLKVALLVFDDVATAAELETGTTVGRIVVVVEGEVAFARDGHAECAVGEDLNLDEFAAGSANVVVADELGNLGHLGQGELACGNDDVGEAGVVADSLDVGDVALGGDVHLDANLVSIGDDGHVGSNNGTDARGLCGFEQAVHLLDFTVVDDGVDGEVGADAGLGGGADDGREVVDGEVGCGAGAHVEFADAEIDCVGTALNCSPQALPGAYGRHDFDFFH